MALDDPGQSAATTSRATERVESTTATAQEASSSLSREAFSTQMDEATAPRNRSTVVSTSELDESSQSNKVNLPYITITDQDHNVLHGPDTDPEIATTYDPKPTLDPEIARTNDPPPTLDPEIATANVPPAATNPISDLTSGISDLFHSPDLYQRLATAASELTHEGWQFALENDPMTKPLLDYSRATAEANNYAASLPDDGSGLKPAATAVADAMTLGQDFGQSALYSGIQEPITAVEQILNWTARQISGTDILPNIDIIEKPPEAEFGTPAWYAETAGAGVGIAAGFLLTDGVGTAFAGAAHAGQAAELVAEAPQALRVAGEATQFEQLANEAGRLAVTGAAYGGLLTPSSDVGADDFWEQRARNAVTSAVTFGTQAFGGGLLISAVRSALPEAESVAGAAVQEMITRAGSNAASGAVAGAVNAEVDSLLQGKGLADLETVAQRALTFAVTGLGTDAVHAATEGAPAASTELNRVQATEGASESRNSDAPLEAAVDSTPRLPHPPNEQSSAEGRGDLVPFRGPHGYEFVDYTTGGQKYELQESRGYYYPETGFKYDSPIKVHVEASDSADLQSLQEVLIPALSSDPVLKEHVGGWKTINPLKGFNVDESIGEGQNAKAFTVYPKTPEDAWIVSNRINEIMAENHLELPERVNSGNVDHVDGESNRVTVGRDIFVRSPESVHGRPQVELDAPVQQAIEGNPPHRLTEPELTDIERRAGILPGTLHYLEDGKLVMDMQPNSVDAYRDGVYADESRAGRTPGELTDRKAIYALYEMYGFDPATTY